MMSISTTSGSARWNRSIASSPLPASSTVQPSSSRASLTAVRMRSSSSTERMRVPTAHMMPGLRPGSVSASNSTIWSNSAGLAASTSPSVDRTAVEAAGAAPGLAGDQLARGPIPRAEPLLEVGVESSGGEVAQVGRRGAEPADVADPRDDLGDALGLLAASLDLVAEARGDERLLQRGRRAAVDGRAVEQGPAAGDRGEQLAAAGM